jgi:4a-hydroxytetrahydrobiopterin dehydratase
MSLLLLKATDAEDYGAEIISLSSDMSEWGKVLTLEELAKKTSRERKGVPPMTKGEAEGFLRNLVGWIMTDGSIEKEFHFKSYLEGLDFAHSVGKIAEEQDHHPDILIRWRRVKVTLSTHSVKGLSENDFIVAAKSELKYRESGFG